MNRRTFLTTAMTGTLAASSISRTAFSSPASPPNIIYAFSDEHRWHSMAFSDMPELHTPNMRRLARQGVEFTHCISNYPVCSPHRAILMSGQWPYQQGVIDNAIPLSPDRMTLGKAFKRAGYRTGYIGKWHLGGTRAEPFGFDHSLIWTDTNTHYDTSSYHPAEGPPVRPRGYNATLMTDQALEFIEQHQEEPFFLMLSWNPPHSHFLDAPPDKQALYPEGSLPQRPNANTREIERIAETEKPVAIWHRNSWPYYKGYHAHVSAIDQELGRLIDYLDQAGLAENTILIYTSDHGSMLGSHQVGGKRQPFEESIRVPFIIRWPGKIPAGVRNDALFGSIDLMPTVCALAGIPVPESCEGQDFSPHLLGKPGGPRPASQFIMHIQKKHASHGEQHPAPLFRGVRTERYTYAVYPDRPWCLFDNLQDPYQLHNLIDEPSLKDLRTELHRELTDWMKRAHDPCPLPDPV